MALGLEVLGNPYGLIRGLAEGVESLFYEPYAGAVQGPGEFAQGVAFGIGKLLGSTLGGAAGAVSRITGALGKGLATITLDKDYQKKRKKVTDERRFFHSIGKNLVKGVKSGLTGVVEKPMEGARQGGLGGLVGGMGKGLIGAVAKPAGGLVDFTSQSLEELRKYYTWIKNNFYKIIGLFMREISM
jgi:vacuolar protein sorting-associated protein 13A/C